MNEKDYYVISSVVKGIQARIDEMPLSRYNRTANSIKEEFDGMMEGLLDVLTDLRAKDEGEKGA